MHASRPQEIRQLVQRQFTDISPAAGWIENETLLIRDGQYCGHRYRTGDLTAVWFLEEDQVKIYNAAGHVIGVFCPSETSLQVRPEAA